MIENPRASAGRLAIQCCEEIRVNVEADFVGLPFDRVEMKIAGKAFSVGQVERRGDIARAAGGEWTVQRAVNGAWLFTDIFHDVDFAALGPADGGHVLAHHPESGPDSLPFWNFDTSFEATVSLGEAALRFEAGGGVIAGYAVGAGVDFLYGGDDQIALFDVGVFGAVGVVFEFVVTPAASADAVGPLGGVGERAVGSGEFVAPG